MSGPYSTKDADGEEIWADDFVWDSDGVECVVVHVFKNGKLRIRFDDEPDPIFNPTRIVHADEVNLARRAS